MLGLADRARVIDLFEAVMRGDVAGRLRRLARRNTTPAPTRRVILLRSRRFTHLVTRLKLVPEAREGSEP